MMVNVKNKYKKFLEEKEKLVKNTGVTSNGDGNKDKKNIKFLPFFSPNKIIKMKDEIIVRVLPNKESFFHEYKKHMFKLSENSFKQFLCMNSIDANGNEYDDCPMCKFLEDNEKELPHDIYNKLTAKTVYLMFVYNNDAKEIQKYETNDFGIVDITVALNKLIDNMDDDFNPDLEGFGLVFRKDKNGYARVFEAVAPKKSVEEILDEAKNEHVIRDFYSEVMPFTKSFTLKQINATFEQAVKAFAPTFDSSGYTNSTVVDDTPVVVNKSRNNNDDVEDIPNEETNEIKTSKTVIEPDDEESNSENSSSEQVTNIKDWLKNRKKAE